MTLTSLINKTLLVLEKIALLIFVALQGKRKLRINKDKLVKLTKNFNARSQQNSLNFRKIVIFDKEIQVDCFDKAWHRDPINGARFSSSCIYFRRPRMQDGADIKCVWELARLNFILPYLLEVQATKSEECIAFSKEVVLSFIRRNRFPFGIHWFNPMEVSIRSVNMCIAWSVLYDFLSESEHKQIEKYLALSATFVLRFREITGVPNNHYMSNLMFLTMWSELTEDPTLSLFSTQEIEKETLIQVHKDGTVFEASTYYHRLTLEILFFTVLFRLKMNLPEGTRVSYHHAKEYYSSSMVRSLYRMFLFLKYAVKDNGALPIVGDNDSGQVLRVYDMETVDIRYLLSLGSYFFCRDMFLIEDLCDHPLAGFIAPNRFHIAPKKHRNISFAKHFRSSGWVSVREGDIALFISCGGNGQSGKGGHAHNDKTSYLLSAGGDDIVVAGGTFCYTCSRSIRKLDRSVINHNVLMVKCSGEILEQNDLNGGDFSLADRCDSRIDRVEQSAESIYVQCSHACYLSATGRRHYRSFFLDKRERKLIIRDSGYQNICAINNLLMDPLFIDRLNGVENFEIERHHCSEIYYSQKPCVRLRFEENRYEIQL